MFPKLPLQQMTSLLSNGYFLFSTCMFQDMNCHLHFCDSFLQGWMRDVTMRSVPASLVCKGIQNREQRLIPMVCLSYWTILPFLRQSRHKSISTICINPWETHVLLIRWSLCYHFTIPYFICCVFPVFPGCKVSGTGNVKILFSNYCKNPRCYVVGNH